MCSCTTWPPCAQPRQANRALLLPLHPIPEAAGFPEQGHCGSHWSPLANKTHRCRERAHKTGHPPQRVRALGHPHPTQGWDQDLQAGGSVRSLCWVWEGSRAPTGSQGSCSSWDTPALPLAALGEGPHSLRLSGSPSPRRLQLFTLTKPLLTSTDPGSIGCPKPPGTSHRLPHTGSIRPQAQTPTHTGTHSPPSQAGTDQGAAGICTPHMVLSAGMALGRELMQLNQLGEIDLGKISEPSARSRSHLDPREA